MVVVESAFNGMLCLLVLPGLAIYVHVRISAFLQVRCGGS